jgi:hypothetical protein
MTNDFLSYTEKTWIEIIKTQELSLEELSCFASHLPDTAWNMLTKYQNLNSKFILDFHFKLNMPDVIQHQRIHQSTIEQNLWLFKQYMWNVCRHQYLSEEFLIQHQDIVNWKQIYLKNHDLSNWLLQKTFTEFFPRDEYIYSTKDVFHQYMHIDLQKKKMIDKLVLKHNQKINKLKSISVSRP